MMLFVFFFFFSSRRRHTRCYRDWSSDVCSSDLSRVAPAAKDGVVLGGASVRDRGMRQVGDQQQVALNGRLDFGECGVELLDPIREAGEGGLGRLGVVCASLADQLADPAAAVIALVLGRI